MKTKGRRNMTATHHRKRIIAGALLCGSLAVAGLGLTAGTAKAEPGFAPQFHGPFPAEQLHRSARWCRSGQPLPMDDVAWDMSLCHHWYWAESAARATSGRFIVGGTLREVPLGPPPVLWSADLPARAVVRLGPDLTGTAPTVIPQSQTRQENLRGRIAFRGEHLDVLLGDAEVQHVQPG